MSEAANRKAYNTNLTDEQWTILEPELPPAPGGGRNRTINLRAVINAILYRMRTGCAWEMLPNDFPPKSLSMNTLLAGGTEK